MNKLLPTIVIFLFTLNPTYSQHTFSIIAVDTLTKEVGSAGATCIQGSAQWGGIDTIINKLIPGRGGINSQAWVCIPNINMNNGIEQLRSGSSPEEVLGWLLANDQCSAAGFSPQSRQYGIVDFDTNGSPRATAFTGDNADDYKGHITGPNYAIQGNILLGPEVLEGMEAGFNSIDGPLHAKLMAAMQGAKIQGADSRCLPFGTSSTTSYLKVTKPTDEEGKPYLSLNIAESLPGIEPIDELQQLYDTFLETTSTNTIPTDLVTIYPNPAQGKIYIKGLDKKAIRKKSLYDLAGQLLDSSSTKDKFMDISAYVSGAYLLKVELADGHTESIQFQIK